MSQADSDPITAETFAAFATFLGTPLPDDPIRAIRILRREAAAEIERLITMLDALGGDPDLEANGDDEPTLGWSGSGSTLSLGPSGDGELEPSLGWTTIVNQGCRNRLGSSHGQDHEKDDADSEDSDPGEDNGDFEPDHDSEPNGDEGDVSVSPSPEYKKGLFVRRGQWREPRPAPDICNVGPIENLSLVIIGPDGNRWEIDRLGYPVVR